MGVKALIYFEVVTTLALVIGLAAINISKAGVGIQVAAPAADSLPAQKLTWQDTLLHTVPENIAKSVADGQILQVVVFSVLFGIALALVREERRRPLVQLTESLAETMFKFTNIVMWFAPLGVGAAIAYTVGSTGMGIAFAFAYSRSAQRRYVYKVIVFNPGSEICVADTPRPVLTRRELAPYSLEP